MSLPEGLPVLAGITALSLGRAVLHLEGGSSVKVNSQNEEICASSVAPYYLATWRGEKVEEGRGYGVPEHLLPTVYAALGLWSTHLGGPPVLTLTSFDQQQNTVTFGALDGEGRAVALTMPRPLLISPTWRTVPRPAGVPVNLSVTREDTPPGQGFTFKVYPETPEGRAVLDVLGLAAQVEASGENQRLN